MSYTSIDHIFLYHAYAAAAGGWVKSKNGSYMPLESVAPAALPIVGGLASASVYKVNSSARGSYPFGNGGPAEFSVYVGHAYTECRGREEDDVDNAMGVYKTVVRSVLDDFRVNDVVTVEHAEAVLVSIHQKPDRKGYKSEAKIYVGTSNMTGLRVNGAPVVLEKDPGVDHEPTFSGLDARIGTFLGASGQAAATVAKKDPWAAEFCSRNDAAGPGALAKDAPQYARDLATINAAAKTRRRYSIFRKVDGRGAYKTSIEVPDFGRIFLGEVICSQGLKHLNMLRFDLGCDNCGGYTGGGGTTNGETMP